MNKKILNLIGYASGIAAGNYGTGDGPRSIQQSAFFSELKEAGIDARWLEMIRPTHDNDKFKEIVTSLHRLADASQSAVRLKQRFATIGGDHSSGIGTWTGVKREIDGPLGLIWIDAHMDAHTPETTPTGNIHGMPVAALLGHGYPELVSTPPVLKPDNICLIGIRDYESGEANLLEKLGVKVFYANEVERYGLKAMFDEAKNIAKKDTVAYGLSLDLDGLDPLHAPAVGTPVAHGLCAQTVCELLQGIASDERFVGFEITEFNPHLDAEHKTEKLVFELMKAIMG